MPVLIPITIVNVLEMAARMIIGIVSLTLKYIN